MHKQHGLRIPLFNRSAIAGDLTVSKEVRITLDDEVLEFIDCLSGSRSRFINGLLRKERQRIFIQKLVAAYEQQANDLAFQSEFTLWDITVSDGITEDAIVDDAAESC